MKQFQFIDFQVQAAEIVDRARLDAEQLVREARAEAERIRERARTEGMAEGRTAAMREERTRAAAEAQRAVDVVLAILRDVDARRDALVQQAERDIVRLAVAIAAKIVKDEIRRKKPVAEKNLAAALAIAGRRQGLVARVHPDDLALIELPRLGPVTLQADPSIDRGGCVLELSPGDVDLQIAEQFKQVKRGLLE